MNDWYARLLDCRKGVEDALRTAAKQAVCRHPDGFIYWDHLSDECPHCGKLIQTRGR